MYRKCLMKQSSPHWCTETSPRHWVLSSPVCIDSKTPGGHSLHCRFCQIGPSQYPPWKCCLCRQRTHVHYHKVIIIRPTNIPQNINTIIKNSQFRIILYLLLIDAHVGVSWFHVPFSRHKRDSSPATWNPSSQKKKTIIPAVKSSPIRLPSEGTPGSGHWIPGNGIIE